MKIVCETLRYGTRVEIPGSEAFRQRVGDGMLIAVGGGRGSTLVSQGDGGGVWLPLRGKLKIGNGDSSFMLEPGQLYVSEPDQRIQAGGRGATLWIALLAQRSGWRRALARAGDLIGPAASLFPAWHRATPGLRRAAVRLIRDSLRPAAGASLQASCDEFLGGVLDLQADFDAMIERCPGRTRLQRQAVFLRLQRVRNHMAANCEQDLGVPDLARMASYSSWHFIRAFHAVYGETPHACLVDRRLERARRLVRSSPLAISEIVVASGFDNRCAFSRLFKQRYGISAMALRRAHGVATRERGGRGRRCAARELSAPAVSATRLANSGQQAAATDF